MTTQSSTPLSRPPGTRLDDLRWTAQIAARIGGVTTVEALALCSDEILTRFADVQYSSLYLFDLASTQLRLFHARGFSDEERSNAEATAMERHPGWVIRTKQPLSVADTELLPEDSPSKESPRKFVVRSRLWLPIVADGESVGAIGLASTRPNAFDAHDQELLLVVVELIALSYQRLRAEQKATRHRFAALLHTVPDAVVSIGADGRILYWNQSAARLLGHAESEAVGQPITLIMPERFLAAHAHGMARHLATGESRVVGRPVELAARHADGHEIPVELMLSRIDDEGSIVFIGVLRDITERHLAAEESRRLATAVQTLNRGAVDDLQAFQRLVTEVVARALDVTRVSLWQSVGEALVCRDLYEQSRVAHSDGLRLVAHDCPRYFAALRAGEVIIAADARTHPDTRDFTEAYLAPLGIVSMLDAPIVSLGGSAGVLCVESTSPRGWRRAEVDFCREVAMRVAQALDLAARRQLAARHAVILASIGDAVIACDTASRVTLLNPVAEALTGFTSAEAVGRPIDEVFRIISSDTREPAPIPVAEVLATGNVHGLANHTVLVRRDGVETPIADSAAPIVEEGVTVGVVLTFRDVGEEERARREIAQQHRQLRSLNEAIPDLLFSVERSGRLRFVKDSVHPDLLVAPSVARELSIDALFSADLAAQLMGAVATTIDAGEVQTVEYALDLPHGRQTFEARMARMSDDEVTVMVRNVTADRANTEALRSQRQQLTALLATTSALVYSARLPDFSIDYISPSATQLLGFTPEEMTAAGFWDWAIHPDDRDRVIADLPALFEHGRHVHEYRHRHKNGGYRWLRDEPRLVFDDAGHPLYVVGASFDITARKRDEIRLEVLYTVQQVVAAVSRAFLASPDADAAIVLRDPLATLGHASRADRVYVCLCDGVTFEHAFEWCAEGAAPQDPTARRVPLEATMGFLPSLRAGRPLMDSTAAATPDDLAAYRAFCAARGAERGLAVPMRIDGALRGVVGIDNPAFDDLEPAEFAQLLQLFADAVAAGLGRAENERTLQRLNVELTHRGERQRELLELATELACITDHAAMFEKVRASLRSFFAIERFSFGEMDRATGAYFLRMIDEPPPAEAAQAPAGQSTPGGFGPALPTASLDLAGTAIAEALSTGVAVTTRDHARTAFRDWVSLHARRGYNQFVIIPLRDSRGGYGTLNVSATQDAPFELEDIRWLAQVGTVAAAHLAALAARNALRSLNLELEDRVAARTRELQQSEERFETLFQYAPQAMLIVDGAGLVSQSNRNAQGLFGYSEPQFLGLPVTALVPEGQRGLPHGLLETFPEAGKFAKVASDRQVSALRRDQSPFTVEIGLVPLRLNGERAVLAGVTDVSERVAAQAEVTRSLREKETLLQEIHHRVKNNLQIISSLLMLQADKVPSDQGRREIEESVQRVRSMALIHQQLYGTESLERIELGTYASQLLASLRSALSPRARVEVRATPVEVSVETAVPLGLILNELITNAFKYGVGSTASSLPERRRHTGPDCDVLLEISAEGDAVRLVVSDAGPGLPAGFDPVRSNTLGLQLVRTLARQLRGKLTVTSEGGTQFAFVCPLRTQS